MWNSHGNGSFVQWKLKFFFQPIIWYPQVPFLLQLSFSQKRFFGKGMYFKGPSKRKAARPVYKFYSVQLFSVKA